MQSPEEYIGMGVGDNSDLEERVGRVAASGRGL